MTRPAADAVEVQWTGTGAASPISLGSAVSGFQGFPAALNGLVVSYAISHPNGLERETGIGTYTSSGNTLSRTVVTYSTALSGQFTAGTKVVRLAPLAHDVVPNLATTDPLVTSDINAGYLAGRGRWLNTTTKILWTCVDHTAGAAVWLPQYPVGNSPGQLPLLVDDGSGGPALDGYDISGCTGFPTGSYVPLATIAVTTATDAPSTGTWRIYSNVGAITVTLNATLVANGECTLVKGAGAGTMTIAPGGGFTILGGSSSYECKGIVTIKRGTGVDFTLSGDYVGAKTIYGDLTFPGQLNLTNATIVRQHVLKTADFTLTAADNGKTFYLSTAGLAYNVTWLSALGNDFICTIIVGPGSSSANILGSVGGAVRSVIAGSTAATLVGANSTRSAFKSQPRDVVTD